jgi:hypothetical protein
MNCVCDEKGGGVIYSSRKAFGVDVTVLNFNKDL